ncbi:MAG: nitroreductase family protein [Firmicutes bacterium]|nr:nitroreductase family protein [Bacillota bacterium]
MKDFYSAIEKRRSIRIVSDESILSEEKLKETIEHAVKYSPTAFNAQEQRVVVLLEGRHKWFWDLAIDTLRAIVPKEKFAPTEAKINGLKSGKGTILIYQDTSVVKGLQKNFPMYHDNFPIWAHESTGMLEYVLWTALASEGYGVSLHHYTELIETETDRELNIDRNWKMVGQIVFGSPREKPDSNKEFKPLEDRLLFFK